MKRRQIILLSSFVLLLAVPIPGQSAMPGYLSYRDLTMTSGSAMSFGLYGFDNPALLNYLHQPDLMFTWMDSTGKVVSLDNWGLFIAFPKLGLGMIRNDSAAGSIIDYRIATSFGNHKTSFGIGFGWSAGDVRVFERANVFSLGSLFRPNKFISFGLNGLLALSGGDREATMELGLRPLGKELITLFGDYNIQRGIELKDGSWSAGIALEPLPGIRFSTRYFDDKTFSTGCHVSLGRGGIRSLLYFNEDAKATHSIYGIRSGAYDRTIMQLKRSRYLEMDLNGPLRHQRFLMFDKAKTLKGLLENIDAAKKDRSIAGIAINTSGMDINIEMLWELRDKLHDFKSTGKQVVIYIDNVNTGDYYFASVADIIVMDPLGMIDLRGLLMGRTFLRGTLEKIGIAFDEWRFFKYKSAAEIFSRDKMSDADREQRQEIVDDIYQTIRTAVAQDRRITPEEFDNLVNNEGLFMAKTSLAKGLVDTLGRWEAVEEVVKTLAGKKKSFVKPYELSYYNLPLDNRWGGKPKIAIIYGLGECAMDAGITARQLVKDFKAATDDKSIKAIVFRVDSPGGDALASDIIAEAIKKCREKKPVIVSQGLVAGSGGYWLSMYGEKVVSSPITITGSIGVIGGWLYNTGFKEKLGVTTDHVKAGEHADLDFGAVLPFIGALVPDRNLTQEERSKMETEIKTVYADFVEKVAQARQKKFDEIESVAQGRVWTGMDAKENGLVDTLGGLELAVNIAKQLARIDEKTDVEIVELPRKGLFNPEMFTPKLISLDEKTKKGIGLIKFYLEHNGQPLPMLPLDYLDLTIE